MLEDEQFELDCAARSVLEPWRKKIAPFQATDYQYYITERNRLGRDIVAQVALANGVKAQRTRFDELLDQFAEASELRRNPQDHLASGW